MITISSILRNEKYKGDALLQKKFTVDFLQKKLKKNEGEVPQYYVEGNHEAIISPAVFDLVQAEMDRRAQSPVRYSGVTIFSNKIKCADCGAWYGSKVWHSNDKYRKVVFRCNNKYDGKKCETSHVTGEEIRSAFVSAFNKLLTEKKDIIANAEIIRRRFCVADALLKEKDRLAEEMSVLSEMMQKLDNENARLAQDQDEYKNRFGGLVERYDAAKAQHEDIVKAITAKEQKDMQLANFISVLKEQEDAIQEFDGRLWGSLVDFITVGREKVIIVTFKDGTEIQA